MNTEMWTINSPSNQATLQARGPFESWWDSLATATMMRYLVMAHFKSTTMHVAVGVWQMTLSLRDITL